MRNVDGEVDDLGVKGEIVADWDGEERVGVVLGEVVMKEEGVEEGLWAEEGSGVFVTELCPCSGTAVGASSSVGTTTGVSDVVLEIPSAVDVVYPGSYVPLIPGQSMLKAAALKAAHSSRRTAVALSSQSSVYIVASSHRE